MSPLYGRKDKSAKAETHRIEEVVDALYRFRPSQSPHAEEVAPPNYTSWLHRKLLICQKEAAGTGLSRVVG